MSGSLRNGRTPARPPSDRVGELALEQGAQRDAGAVEAELDGGLRDPEPLRGLGGAQVLDVAEQQNRARGIGKAVDAAAYRRPELARLEGVRGGAPRAGLLEPVSGLVE